MVIFYENSVAFYRKTNMTCTLTISSSLTFGNMTLHIEPCSDIAHKWRLSSSITYNKKLNKSPPKNPTQSSPKTCQQVYQDEAKTLFHLQSSPFFALILQLASPYLKQAPASFPFLSIEATLFPLQSGSSKATTLEKEISVPSPQSNPRRRKRRNKSIHQLQQESAHRG